MYFNDVFLSMLLLSSSTAVKKNQQQVKQQTITENAVPCSSAVVNSAVAVTSKNCGTVSVDEFVADDGALDASFLAAADTDAATPGLEALQDR